MTPDKLKFVEFVQGLTYCDHMGDVCDDIDGILKYLGVSPNHPMIEKYGSASEGYLKGVSYALHDIYGIGEGE